MTPSSDRLAAAERPIAEDVVRLLRELLDVQRRMLAVLERHPRPHASTLTRQDRARLAAMLPALGGVFGSDLFLTRDVLESEAAAVQLVRRGLTATQLGRLLRRAADMPIDGYLVTRQGTEAGAVLWRIVQVCEFPSD